MKLRYNIDSMLKKFLIIFGILLVLAMGTLAILPFVIDVNSFKPLIVSKINETINGKIEIEKIEASILRGIVLHGVRITNPEGFSELLFISVSKADLNFNFLNLLIGDVKLTAKFSRPDITVERTESNGWNIARMLKSKSEQIEESFSQQKTEFVNKFIGKWIKTAHIGFGLKDANLLFLDQLAGKRIHLKSVNLELDDVSLNKPINLYLDGEIDASLFQGMDTKGKFSYKGTILPKFSSSGLFHNLSFNGTIDLTKMLIVQQGKFNKQPGTEFKLLSKGIFRGGDKVILLESYQLNLASLKVNGEAEIPTFEPKSITLKLQTKDFEIAPLKSLSPTISNYFNSGTLNFSYEGAIAFSPVAFEGRGSVMGKELNITLPKGNKKNKKLKFSGFVLANTNFTFSVSGRQLTKLHGTSDLNLNQASVTLDGELNKSKGTPLKANGNFSLIDNRFTFENVKILFNNLNGRAYGYTTLSEPKIIDLTFTGDEINLEGWNNILPKLGKIKPTGSIQIQKIKITAPLNNIMVGIIESEIAFKEVKIGAQILNGKDFHALGPLLADGMLSFQINNKKLVGGKSNLKFNLNDAELKKSKLFSKSPKVPLFGTLDLFASEDKLKFNSATIHAINTDFIINGEISSLKTLTSSLTIDAKPFQLEPWTNSLHFLKEFPIAALIEGRLKLNGPLKNSKKLKYGGFLKVKDGFGKLRGISPPLAKLNALIKFTDYGGDIETLSAKIGETDLNITGNLIDFANPKGTISITSEYANLDELFPPGPEIKATSSSDQPSIVSHTPPDTFRIFRVTPFFQKAQLKGDLKIKALLSRKMTIGPLVAALNYREQRFTLEDFSLGLYEGRMIANSVLDTTKIPSTFEVWGNLIDVNLQEMLSAKNPKLKGTIEGKLSSDYHLNGAGFSQLEIRQSLSGRGKLSILNAEFKTIDFTDAIYEALESIPGVTLRERPKEKRFQFARGDYIIEKGRIITDELYLRGQGFSIKLRGAFDFDQNINYKGDYFLSSEEDPLEAIPFKISGTLTSASIKPDIKEYARRYLKTTIEETIRKGTERILEKLNP